MASLSKNIGSYLKIRQGAWLLLIFQRGSGGSYFLPRDCRGKNPGSYKMSVVNTLCCCFITTLWL